MKVQNKKNSSYVITGNPSFLSSGGLAPLKEGSRLCSLVSHAIIIAWFPLSGNIQLFSFCSKGERIVHRRGISSTDTLSSKIGAVKRRFPGKRVFISATFVIIRHVSTYVISFLSVIII